MQYFDSVAFNIRQNRMQNLKRVLYQLYIQIERLQFIKKCDAISNDIYDNKSCVSKVLKNIFNSIYENQKYFNLKYYIK